MKVLTAAQMRDVDRKTIEMGIPSLILMENAGHRVVELLQEKFPPLSSHHVVVLCGKGNNGGDGLVVARQLHTRLWPRSLHVVLATPPEELRGDAAENYRMLDACGCVVFREITAEMREATVVVDALLGTGLVGAASGPMLELIREINSGFPRAKVVALDIPSGVRGDTGNVEGETVRADYTVTFTAPKVGQVLPPGCDRMGELRVAPIGSPPELYENDNSIWLSVVERRWFHGLFLPREPGANKGHFGHVLVIGGSRGKTGAAAMAGIAALRSGAGLVTVASAESAIPVIASHSPEIMTEALAETEAGSVSLRAFDYQRMASILEKKTVVALGPGLGMHPDTTALVQRLVAETAQPLVIDADGLNALAGAEFQGRRLVLTPHPGEMSRLTGQTIAEIQADRPAAARALALERRATVVLKGQRTVTAFPDGRVWINPTGTPAMATGGGGGPRTPVIAGMIAQFPAQIECAVAAAVWLHGRAGELGALAYGEKPLVATDLLEFLPEAIDECAAVADEV